MNVTTEQKHTMESEMYDMLFEHCPEEFYMMATVTGDLVIWGFTSGDRKRVEEMAKSMLETIDDDLIEKCGLMKFVVGPFKKPPKGVGLAELITKEKTADLDCQEDKALIEEAVA